MKNFFIIILALCIVAIDSFYFVKKKSYSENEYIRVAIYCDTGVGEEEGAEIEYARNIETTIKTMDPYSVTALIKADDIINGALDSFDVVIFPGGTGMGESASLGEQGRDKVREFVNGGGGYIGICAGAYLGQDRDMSYPVLKLSNSEVYNGAVEWDRGGGIIKVRITESSRKYFPELYNKKFVYMLYQSGPILVRGNTPDMGPYNELMVFESDIYHDNPKTKGESRGKTLLLAANYGSGRTVLMSAHPEDTPGMKWMMYRLVQIAAKRDIKQLPPKYVNPNKYKGEIMFDTKWKEREKRYLDTALNTKKSGAERVKMMRLLKNMGSREILKHIPALLADKSRQVRKYSAELLIYYDYFPHLAYLKERKSKERDLEVSRMFSLAIRHLQNMPGQAKTALR